MGTKDMELALLFVMVGLLAVGAGVWKVATSVMDARAAQDPARSGAAGLVVRALSDGDCIRGIPATTSTPVDKVGCGTTHDAEVIGRVTLSDSAVSAGGPAAVEAAHVACANRFALQNSAAPEAYWAAVPSALDWAGGERLVVCFRPT